MSGVVRNVLEHLLTAFVVLKIAHVIAWPWVLVLSPFLVPFGLWLVLLAVAAVAAVRL